MLELTLREYKRRKGVELSAADRDVLGDRASVTVVPSLGREGAYDLTPGSTVGVLQTRTLSLEIRPKLPIDRVLFLISYALDIKKFGPEDFRFGDTPDLFEAMIPGFVAQVRRAFRRGLLCGYRVEEEALHGVRGRIRFNDQIRDRFGIFPPVEVSYDDFTEDTEMNRLIKAAIVRLGRMRIRSRDARTRLRAFDRVLGQVADVEYRRGAIPEFSFNRLSRHYEPAIRLAQLILRSTSIEFSRGGVRSSSFLVDMNKVFEDFMVTALRESLGVTERDFPQGASGRRMWLAGDRIDLEPDISWWEGRRCVFVGDLKYKKTDHGIPNADLYQLLAYTIAADLPSGLLIYAQGEEDPTVYAITNAGKLLEIMAVDLSGSPEQILAEVGKVAELIRSMRHAALRHRAA
ncbi:MAG: hypothetical protein OXJ36_00160 [bacterium]|nr:hypothetical protein [bacterium]MDE0436808.1 hypothetical protein [bacterium]